MTSLTTFDSTPTCNIGFYWELRALLMSRWDRRGLDKWVSRVFPRGPRRLSVGMVPGVSLSDFSLSEDSS